MPRVPTSTAKAAIEPHPQPVAGLETNTLVDGFFHPTAWMLVAVGSWLMLGASQRGRLAPPWRVDLGLLLAGWGARPEALDVECLSMAEAASCVSGDRGHDV